MRFNIIWPDWPHGIELTRSRPYQKNDQAWVEQKTRGLRSVSEIEGSPAEG